jgi:hypothetical protein
VDNARLRPVRVQGLFATTDYSRTVCCHGQENVVCAGAARLSSGQYADTFRHFTRSCGDRLTGNCWLALAVGGEQRGHKPKQRAATDSDV